MKQSRRATITLLVASIVTAIVVFLPLWWVFVSSLRPGNTYVNYTTPLSWLAFIPIGGDLTNYVSVFSGPFLIGLATAFLLQVSRSSSA